MSDKEFLDGLEAVLRRWMRAVSLDLAQCVTQKMRTSKHERRERALSYLLETLSSHMCFLPTEEEAILLINLIETVKGKVEDEEAGIGLERAEKRLRWKLSNEDLSGVRRCVACGEAYRGDNHECTSKAAAAKDAAMARDDSVK